ncbi:MAG TPA: hypothetical protein VK908_12860 [Jiangellales bacterium]|nr:hypothetical protein [Jiangellales bacterium]
MHVHRPAFALGVALLTAAPLSVVTAYAADSSAAPGPPSAVAVDWQRIALRTIFTENATPPQVGALHLAFTSVAVHDAVQATREMGSNAARAAVATAAHDVLSAYFVGSRVNLAADLAASLATVPDGPGETRGILSGRAAAAAMVQSRVGDGVGDPSIVYAKPAAIGVWQPPPGGAMATPWLGFVRPLVPIAPVLLDGPDAVTSPAYAADYEEVRRLGSVGSAQRSQGQTDVARFFAFNSSLMYRDALCRLLDAEPTSLARTARLFALIDASVANAMIETFRHKFEIGFWRPVQAINTVDDGNPATEHEAGWAPRCSCLPCPCGSRMSAQLVA